jgi:hypothetical protein
MYVAASILHEFTDELRNLNKGDINVWVFLLKRRIRAQIRTIGKTVLVKAVIVCYLDCIAEAPTPGKPQDIY